MKNQVAGKLFSLGAIVLLAALAVPNLFAANHYVRAGATGNGSGSDWANACTDFTGSCDASRLARGDTYYVAGGTYGNATFTTPDSGRGNCPDGSACITIKGATVTDHGTDMGWSNSYGVDASPANWPKSVRFETDHWVWDGSVGSGTSGYGFKITTDAIWGGSVISFGVNGSHQSYSDYTIKHFEFDGVTWQYSDNTVPGPSVFYNVGNSVKGIIIEYTYTHDMKGRINQFQNVANVTLKYNWSTLNRYTAQQHSQGWAFNGTNSNITIAYNTFWNVTGPGILLWINSGHTTDAYLYGNVYYMTPGSPVGGPSNGVVSDNKNSCGGTQGYLTNLYFYQNTLYNIYKTFNAGVRERSAECSDGTGSASNWNVENNLWVDIPSDIAVSLPHNGGTVDYNTFLNVAWGNPGGGSHTYWTSSGSANPFVSSTDFRLASENVDPHLADGTMLSSPYNMDPGGKTRGADGTWERGAYEYGGTTSQASPPAPPTNVYATAN